MKTKQTLCRKIKLLFLVILVTVPFGCSFHFIEQTRPLQETVVAGKGKDKIVIVDVSGIITTKKTKRLSLLPQRPNIVSRIREELAKAYSDKRVKGLVLRINSPGGGVTASDIIYREIKRFKNKKKIPIVVCMMDVATSGAYYISLAADTIVAHPTTITGGIGVIAFKFNAEELLEKVGIKDESVKSGDKKDLLSPFRSNTEEERRILRAIIDDLHSRFVDVVAENRDGLTEAEVRRIADGRVYTAEQAFSLKLIDKTGYLDDSIETAKKMAGVDQARIVIYHRPFSHRSNIYSEVFPPGINTINLMNINVSSIEEIVGVRFMYLWAP